MHSRLFLLRVTCIALLLSTFGWLRCTPIASDEPENVLSLAGAWRFRIDSLDEGMDRQWFAQTLPETVQLPGSMQENGKGNDVTLATQWTGSIYDSSWYFNPRMEKYRQPDYLKFPFWLTPVNYYVGPAWYQKQVTVPDHWQGQHLTLLLERAHIGTHLWVDSTDVGTQNSLVAPHVYDLTDYLTPGTHTLTIRVDNRQSVMNVGPDSHSITDHTQGNWNGLVGRLELRARAPVWLDSLQVYPDLTHKKARLTLKIRNATGQPATGTVRVVAQSFNVAQSHTPDPVTVDFQTQGETTDLTLDLPMGDSLLTWDEFSPALYRLTAELTTDAGQRDQQQTQFGMREFTTNGTRFYVNGRETFLRGTVENATFPLTGYVPMDVAAWERVFRICKEYGLNHMRYHSYCPPEAAFQAADRVGIYLQPEGPSWANHGSSLGDGRPVDLYIYDETNRMGQWYGNYASFCMMAYGNEPRGGHQADYLGDFVEYWEAKDPRRKYTGASVGMSWPLVPQNEFMVKSGPRGLAWDQRPETESDYRERIQDFDVPYVAHEMGQYCVYPNFKEMRKYTGVYQPNNFELFQEDLADHHMADQADDFLMASGRLQVLCYKHEIEKSLRTPGAAGFQLLSLNDYPGQGTALVGMLDVFWDEKGYFDAEQMRQFCNTTVPLIRVPTFVYQNDETLTAAVEVAHFGPAPLRQARPEWRLLGVDGSVVAGGILNQQDIPIGSNTSLGTVEFPLASLTEPTKLHLEVTLAGTAFQNGWDFWVYPAQTEAAPEGVYITTQLDARAEQILQQGGNVFLDASGKITKGKEVVQHFRPVFWNTSWFKMRPPHTLGILVDADHPAFAAFPTEAHSDLQWWSILERQQVMHLEDFPPDFRPLVQPIDTWFLNRRLASVLEARVGAGKLLMTSSDLTSDLANRPAARQLRQSLLAYMASEEFSPQATIPLATIRALLTEESREQFDPYTLQSPDELQPNLHKPTN
ncbi:Glycosyl hydrolases family 2, TIM barrel domain [Catalinimonas alkaloidigena]|uniref:beta-galactosidase n=1 Tax=Catalinimonas alkaloidigena TaxID=1075417 RepID=A0A1G9SVZ9_9BACT|nr:sugar-binding domain-containing protein [Catalinimonas alkaloidigena]SDM39592.1 Glycosyl hydrolases family 2, TIM barrel domain [Catalinimonas alkaloidigena]